MKVLNLQCQHHHVFEGWFSSEDDYQSQRERDLVECPVCGDITVHKMLSAPRLNLLTSRLDPAPVQNTELAANNVSSEPDSQVPATLESQSAWLKMVQHVIANTEDVGPEFAEEARKMHYGETEERNIRGQVSREETLSLLEEGINVVPLPIPAALKGSVH